VDSLLRVAGESMSATAIADDDKPTVTLKYGDASWHDGVGWYWVIDGHPDEGSCGAFTFKQDAIAHAEQDGYVVTNKQAA
jgi:hypothetical protein